MLRRMLHGAALYAEPPHDLIMAETVQYVARCIHGRHSSAQKIFAQAGFASRRRKTFALDRMQQGRRHMTDHWPDDMILTEAHARELMDRGACSDALSYVGKTVAAAAAAEPWAALAYAADKMTDAQFSTAAAAKPWAALAYAADRLTDAQFAAAAAAKPWAALAYAADRLTDAQFATAVAAKPWAALAYAADRLTDAQFATAAAAEPEAALAYAADRLTDAQFATAAAAEPEAAMRYAADRYRALRETA